MEIACLDLEGVLVPEIWINFAERTGIEELRLTTRDVPDYDALMTRRLSILEKNNLGLPDIQEVIGQMHPLPGAPEFLDWLKEQFQVVILSDTFYQFAKPLMRSSIFRRSSATTSRSRTTGAWSTTTCECSIRSARR